MKSVLNNLKMPSLDDLFEGETPSSEEQTKVELSELIDFNEHPFYVSDTDDMARLIDSIQANGVLNPIIVREKKDKFEIISGHRRVYACKKLNLKEIPAIIKSMTDDEATIAMVDANINRESLLPSERAYAYKMRRDAFSHQGKKLEDVNTPDNVRTMQRYIQLTNLTKELLAMVDEKRIGLVAGITLSSMDEDNQVALGIYLRDYEPKKKVSGKIAEKFAKKAKETSLEYENMFMIFNGEDEKHDDNTVNSETEETNETKTEQKHTSKKIVFDDDVLTYYFGDKSIDDITKIMKELLEDWRKKND